MHACVGLILAVLVLCRAQAIKC